MKGGWPEHQGGTVVGTKNVLDACAKYGVRKLVYVSSLSVLHWLHGNRENVLTESAPLEPHPEERGAYTRAKLEAERLVTQFCQTHSLPTIILRPGQIFGGQIPVLSPAVARRMGARWIILGDGALRLPLVHMDRVADAVVAATAAEMPTGQIIHLVDADPMTQNEVLRLVQGADARIVHVPRAFLLAVGYCSQVALGLLKRQSPLAPYRLRSALNPCRFDSAHAPQFLPGWDATRSVRDGILRTSPVPSSPKPEWTPPSQGEPATHPQAQEALA
jgi:nucleoside-diphosphate-sugar epimerase